ncbi:MAG: epimerase [Thermoprotei archaeon]|nr:MAG: epimerase [Thermoprotei archaeon]
MVRVLITGGAGFIGHSLALHLVNSGFNVVVYDSLERASSLGVSKLREKNIPIIVGDVRDEVKLRNSLKGVDVVVHAAAYVDVEESVRRPLMYFSNNVLGTVSIAKCSLESNVDFLAYLSSAAVYGNPKYIPIDENHPTEPISPYGLTKLMGEHVLRFYSRIYGLKKAILRIFNVYGPGQTGSYAGVVSKFIERVKRGLPPIIYGDGFQTRDFIHVDDVCEAIRLLIEKRVCDVFNVASGREVSINELANIVLRIAKFNVKPIYEAGRPSDIRRSVADISKIVRVLGFKPRISLEQGLEMLFNYG